MRARDWMAEEPEAAFDIRELEARQAPVALRGEFRGQVFHAKADGAEWVRLGYEGQGSYKWEYACPARGCQEPIWGDGTAEGKICPHCDATVILGAVRPQGKVN